MASNNSKTTRTQQKEPTAAESSLSIEEQTRAFLAAGGKVERISTGVSGEQNLSGPKHIILGNSK